MKGISVIRPASLKDRAGILDVLQELARESPHTGETRDVDVPHLERQLTTLMANPGAIFLLAVKGGSIVGLIVVLLYDRLLSAEP